MTGVASPQQGAPLAALLALASLVTSAVSLAAEVPPVWIGIQFDFDCPACTTEDSESAAVADVISRHDVGCGVTAAPEAGWYWGPIDGLDPLEPTLHIARRDYQLDYRNDPPACVTWVNESHTLTMQRLSGGCPTGYSGPFTMPPPDGPYLVCTTEDGPRDYFENPQAPACAPVAGNPCDLATGAKIERAVDYSGPGFEFYRTYRSNLLSIWNSGSPQAFPFEAAPYGVLGGNWVHNFGSMIVYEIQPFRITGWISPDGVLVEWHELQPNVFVAKNGSGMQLRPTNPNNLGGDDWIVYYPSGAKEVHRWLVESNGVSRLYLKERQDPRGNATVVNYAVDANGRETGGWIRSIVGPFGHTLTFVPTTQSPPPPYQVKWDYLLDPAGEKVDFVHSPQDPSAPGNWLLGVIRQDGSRVDYLYAEHTPGITDPRDFLLRGIVDENGDPYATFEYWDVATDGSDLRTRSTRHGSYQHTAFTYAYGGESTTVTDAFGNETIYDFQPDAGTGWEARNPAVVTGPDGASTSQVNEQGVQRRIAETVDDNGVITRYEYDDFHLVRRLEDFDPHDPLDPADDTWARETTYQYLNDTSDLKTLIREPSVSCPGRYRDTLISYVPGTQWVASMTEVGRDPYDCARPMSRSVWFLDFNEFGQPRKIFGPGVSTSIYVEYYECETGYACGQIRSIRNGLGHETLYQQYDAHGNLTQSVDPNGLQTTYTYTPRQFVDTITTTDGVDIRTVGVDYDAAGQIERVAFPGGMELHYAWNEAHRLESIVDSDGNAIDYSYDLRGDLVGETLRAASGAVRKTLEVGYDPRRRVQSIREGANSPAVLWHDAAASVSVVTDPNGSWATYQHDRLDRLTRITDELNGFAAATEYAYDLHDNLVEAIAPNGARTTFEYDDLGRLLKEVSPDRGTLLYGYDAAGNRSCMADGRYTDGYTQCGAVPERWTYTYDALNRVDTIDYGATAAVPDVNYDYDGPGELGRLDLVSQEHANGEIVDTQFDHDPFGNLVARRQFVPQSPVSPAPFETRYEYDSADRLVRVVYPSGRIVDYTRDVSGRIRQISSTAPPGVSPAVTQVVNNVLYEPFGPPASIALGNGLYSLRVYDTAYRVTQHGLTDQAPSLVDYHLYTLDPVGNVLRDQDLLDPDNDRDYEYDLLGRLTNDSRVDTDSTTDTYAYDGNGNRLSRFATEPGFGQQTLAYDVANGRPNRMLSLNGIPIPYDGGGNMLANGAGASFAFSPANRLDRISRGGDSMRMLYNGVGELARTRTAPACPCGGCATWRDYYHFGSDGRALGMVQESSLGSAVERDWIWLDGIPVAQFQESYDAGGAHIGTQLTYLHADHLGTPRVGTNEWGTPVWRNESDAFGRGPVGTAGRVVPLRFPGQLDYYFGGIYYNYRRDYDPNTGRYVESDPIGLDGGANTYGYALQNPVRFVDRTGEAVPLAIAIPTIGGAINAVASAYNAYRRCDSDIVAVLAAAGRGFAGGFAGTLAGLGVGVATRNPALAGSFGGLAGNLVEQALSDSPTDPISATASTAVGAVGGPIARRLVPTRGLLPQLLRRRALDEYGPNSIRLLQQEAISGSTGAAAGVLQHEITGAVRDGDCRCR